MNFKDKLDMLQIDYNAEDNKDKRADSLTKKDAVISEARINTRVFTRRNFHMFYELYKLAMRICLGIRYDPASGCSISHSGKMEPVSYGEKAAKTDKIFFECRCLYDARRAFRYILVAMRAAEVIIEGCIYGRQVNPVTCHQALNIPFLNQTVSQHGLDTLKAMRQDCINVEAKIWWTNKTRSQATLNELNEMAKARFEDIDRLLERLYQLGNAPL